MSTLPTPTFPLVLDNSMRADFSSCPRRFWYSTILGLQPAASNVHLHFGGCYAAGLEALRTVYYYTYDLDQAIVAGFRAIIFEWDDLPPDFDPKGIKTLYTCLELLLTYAEYEPPISENLYPIPLANNTPAVEFSFALPLPLSHPETGEPLLYAGRFDGIYNHLGQEMVLDDKTTSRLGQTWGSQWTLRSQFMGYIWAAREFGYPTKGCIIKGHAIYANRFDFAQHPVYHSEAMLDRWYEQLEHDVRRMLEGWKTFYWDYNLADSCTSYNRPCSYTSFCSAEDWTQWIDPDFLVQHWSPLDRKPSIEAIRASFRGIHDTEA